MANERLAAWLRPVVFLGHNRTTLAGAVVTTSSAITLIGFWATEIFRGSPVHPYAGILFFLILPGFFVFGLLLMPLGLWLRFRKLRAAGEIPPVYPAVDLHSPVLLRAGILVGIATALNVALLGTATYQGVHHMDSNQFCGLTCHVVMEPEYTAFVDSPHSRVGCVQCHIGPGAPWFVKAKLSGVRQVFAVNLGTYSRPIPSPVRELRPARETCEQCHWPEKFHGDKILVRTKFAEDEKNTPLTTVVVLKIGGRTWQGKTGIHGRHLDTVERIQYVTTDGRRQVIPRITYVDDKGETVVYESSEVRVTPAELVAGEHRKMDCMDCHNRPSHTFQMPERAVDDAMDKGQISAELPFAKKQSVALLRADYPNREAAYQQIPAGFADFYRNRYPEVFRSHRAQIETASQQVLTIYRRNVFPRMNVGWGTYANNIGHSDFLGCFRCHGGSHSSKDGRTITNDCSACHTLLAVEETNPKILADLGLKQ
jgi:hypothetical protein